MILLITLLCGSSFATFVLPNCTEKCPPREAPCWDIGMNNGDCCDYCGQIPCPVYTQLHVATNCTPGCWKAISVIFEGTNARSQLNHDIFTRAIVNGSYVNSYPNGPYWTAFWVH